MCDEVIKVNTLVMDTSSTALRAYPGVVAGQAHPAPLPHGQVRLQDLVG